jgi:hypothetical protein
MFTKSPHGCAMLKISYHLVSSIQILFIITFPSQVTRTTPCLKVISQNLGVLVTSQTLDSSSSPRYTELPSVRNVFPYMHLQCDPTSVIAYSLQSSKQTIPFVGFRDPSSNIFL